MTMMRSFTHQRSEASLTEREGPKHPLRHFLYSPYIINTQLSVEKQAGLSVDPFDEYFSWQTGHLTLCTGAMRGEKEAAAVAHMKARVFSNTAVITNLF